jgi:DNA-binding MarR family transcriptional regulator/predicted GNAT family acetyltransferase
MRLLWELGHQDGASASNLHEYLGVDPAWVSRTLRTFRQEGWIDATPAEHDARIRHLTLTGRGRKVLVPLELAANTEVRATLANLSRSQQERLVDAMGTRYLRSRNPAREHCWIAEGAGERAGCVCVVERTPTVAQLRLLLVDPSARGTGLGSRLVEECIRFSRAAGYRRLMLWTQANLKAATHIYRKKGFRLVKREKHRAFGTELPGETYSLSLTAPGK